MVKIIFEDSQINEHSRICMSIDSECHVCGSTRNKCISTENSNGDNNWVTICQECIEAMFAVEILPGDTEISFMRYKI